MKLTGCLKRGVVAAMAIGALLLSAPMSAAQEPAKGADPKGGDQRGHKAGAAGRHDGTGAAGQQPGMAGRRDAMGEQPRAAGPLRLLTDEKANVQVIQNDNGVTILVTSDDAELAARIKQELPGQADWLKNMGNMMRNRPGAPEEPTRAGGYDPNKVTVEVEPADNGAAIVVSSKDPQQAELIKKTLPRQIEMMRQMGGRFGNMRDRMQGARELLGLLLSDNVELAMEEKGGSVILKMTPNNPEDLAKIKALLEERLDNLEQMRERMKEMGGEGGIPGIAPGPGGPGMPPGGPGMAPGAPGMAPGGPGAGPGGPQPGMDPEMRKLIREEIRKYLEEKDKKK